MKFRCQVCGYIHEGPKLPDICPVCGVDASRFEAIEEPAQTGKTEDIVNAVRTITYGLFIVSAHFEGKDNGQAANTCFQVTSEPVQVAIGINKQNYTHELIAASGKFAISILDQTGHDLVRNFGYRSGRNADKFEKIKAHRGKLGILLPDNALANLEAEVVNRMDTGTHTLFLGRVLAGEVLGQGEPMTYEYFRRTK